MNFHAEDETGCLTSIEAETSTLPVSAWGCEFGNWHGFFSQERMGGTNATVMDKTVTVTRNQVRTKIEVSLPQAHCLFSGSDNIEAGKLIRTYRLEAMEPSLIGDFVIRSGFSCKLWPKAILGDRVLVHRGKNSLIEEDLGIVRMVGKAPTMEVKPGYGRFSLPFRHLTYVRDQPGEAWIVHQRLLTKNGSCDEYVFRVRHHVFSSSTHRIVANRVVRKIFWRLAEHFWGKIPTIQIGGNVKLLPGSEVELQSIMTLHSGDSALGS